MTCRNVFHREDGEADAVLALEFVIAVWRRLMRDRHD
jgi:hypothetical protein